MKTTLQMMNNFLEIYGAQIHNLKNIDVRIPRNVLTVITGVSGSGKSSLAFDTIYEEGKRRYLLFCWKIFEIMSYEWQFSTPEAEGLDRSVLSGLDSYIAQKRYRLVNSVIIVKNGKIVFERYYNGYDEHSRNNIKSIWKSILSIVTGICLTYGMLPGIDEPVSRYLAQFAEKRHMFHKLMTIRHLLTMSSGIYWHGGFFQRAMVVEGTAGKKSM